MNSRVICFIGANGAGKTSTAAKISAYAAKTLGKKVRWITADALRAGAIAKAQAFTAPMGIPLSLAYSPEELAELAKGESDTELVLIDTPGCNPYRAEEIQELGALLAGIPERCTLLVAPATGKEADLQDEAAVFATFHVQELVISKMDETHSYGCVYNFAYRNQLPIAYFTVGTRILGDLLPADSSFLVNALLG